MRAEGKDYIVKDGDVMNSCLTFDFLTGLKHIFPGVLSSHWPQKVCFQQSQALFSTHHH
nr:hypothetical protein [Enterobacter ludwigii]